jgi:hypothetical protein
MMSVPANAKQAYGLPDVFITEDGNVWRNGKQKKVFVAKNGYLSFAMSVKNKTQIKTIHRVLMETFVGPCPNGMETLHIDGNRLNNDLKNLRWGTRKENVQDAMRHGTLLIGTKNNQSKFTKENLNELKNMYESGVKKGIMALHFDVSDTTIYRIFSGKTYTKELA